jgi:hypothetical protein
MKIDMFPAKRRWFSTKFHVFNLEHDTPCRQRYQTLRPTLQVCTAESLQYRAMPETAQRATRGSEHRGTPCENNEASYESRVVFLEGVA